MADIDRQVGRIFANGGARFNRGGNGTPRSRVNAIRNRYQSNMQNAVRVGTTSRGVPLYDQNRKVSRATYMGLSNG